MIINHQDKYIFIAVPKTASTSIHLAWGHFEHPEPPLYHMTLSECLKENGCDDYFKFMFVRNPYMRFISTWANLTDPRAGHTWASSILPEYGDINNFCRKFSESKWSQWIHFRKQIQYCYVDGVNKMDFIGRQENFNADFQKACEMIPTPTPNVGRTRTSKHGSIDDDLTPESKEIIYEFYRQDFEEFGYEK